MGIYNFGICTQGLNIPFFLSEGKITILPSSLIYFELKLDICPILTLLPPRVDVSLVGK